jgi:hypothetical protein
MSEEMPKVTFVPIHGDRGFSPGGLPMPATATKTKIVQTTARIPEPLYEEARCAAEQTQNSINDVLVSALKVYLKKVRKMKIDASFKAMSTDQAYLDETERIENEFSESDWEVQLEK